MPIFRLRYNDFRNKRTTKKKLYGELHNLYTTNTIRMIKINGVMGRVCSMHSGGVS
jgi:hypothetical protein